MDLLARLTRPDWLHELQVALVICLMVVTGFGVLTAIEIVRGESVVVELPASSVAGPADFGLREGAVIADTQDLEVVINHPTPGQRLAWGLSLLPSHVLVVAMLAVLVWTVRHAQRADPFSPTTVRLLRVLAVVAFGGVLGSLVESGAELQLTGTVWSGTPTGEWSPPLHWILGGFGLLAVAEIVKRGCAMRSELETVV